MFSGYKDQIFGHIHYSCAGEDLAILNIFKLIGIERPSYIDIGAHHPFNISNTAMLYERGSRGVNIEANYRAMSEFTEHRPEDINVNVGVGPVAGVFPFYMYDQLSGRNTFSEDNAQPFDHEGKKFIPEPVELKVITLPEAIDQYCNGVFPDLLTIDIEGMDEKVLRSTNLTHGPKVICIEALAKDDNEPLKNYLSTQGYFCYCRVHVDLIFIKNEFKEKVY